MSHRNRLSGNSRGQHLRKDLIFTAKIVQTDDGMNKINPNCKIKVKRKNIAARFTPRELCVLCVLCGLIVRSAQPINRYPTPINFERNQRDRLQRATLGDATSYFISLNAAGDFIKRVVTKNRTATLIYFTPRQFRPLSKITIYHADVDSGNGRVDFICANWRTYLVNRRTLRPTTTRKRLTG